MSAAPVRLRPMGVEDIEPANAAFLATQGWGDRSDWFAFAIRSAHVHAFVALAEDGRLIGTGAASVHGRVAWIGTIWVAPDRRSEGIGRRLTEATIDAAEAAGCRTLVLVASDMGLPIYQRLGFTTIAWETILEAPGLVASGLPETARPDRQVRAWQSEDLDHAAALDAVATGEDRRHLLEAFATPESALVVTGADDRPRGFVVRAPWGGGATIAPDPDDAQALLAARRRAAGPEGAVRAGLMDSNAVGLARLAADGWAQSWRARRMSRGEPLDWQPTHIWGQFNHALG